jgi:prepilin-type N-terminal cleavage/methylation domain-containing protein
MRRHQALTLVETVVVMALIAILASGWMWSSRPSVAEEARRLASSLTRLRYIAASSGGAALDLCASGAHGHGVLAPMHATVTWPRRGLLFTSDGLPRTCDGGGVGNATIGLELGGRQAAVIVSSLGRVRWESR